MATHTPGALVIDVKGYQPLEVCCTDTNDNRKVCIKLPPNLPRPQEANEQRAEQQSRPRDFYWTPTTTTIKAAYFRDVFSDIDKLLDDSMTFLKSVPKLTPEENALIFLYLKGVRKLQLHRIKPLYQFVEDTGYTIRLTFLD